MQVAFSGDMKLPTTSAEVERLIADQVQESLHLDYKESAGIGHKHRDEIAKDVSAFANSDGGLIIYGVVETGHLPIRIDAGVDHQKFSREWLEQVIRSNVSPQIDDLRIAQIPISSDRSLYAVSVSKSFRGPHQAPDKKYYRRYNFQSVAMEDYEINDVRQRRKALGPLVTIDVELKNSFVIYLTVSNKGDVQAEDVVFEFPENFWWLAHEPIPKLFLRGIKHLPPERTFSFWYGTFPEVLKEGDIKAQFDISVSYFHPEAGCRTAEVFHIDLIDYVNSMQVRSELNDHGKKIEEAINKLTSEMGKLNSVVNNLPTIADATGLSLSIPTLKNLRHLLLKDDLLEKIDPSYCNHQVFIEVLGSEYEMACRLRDFFAYRNQDKKLINVEGMTEELIEKIKQHFILGGDM